MAHTRRNLSLDIRANRAWTADAFIDLASIDARHGDTAYVTASTNSYLYLDGNGWVKLTGLTGGGTGDEVLTWIGV